MSDFVSDFWHYYVVVITVGGLLYCAWLLMINTTKRKSGPAELHSHVWDEDLQEFNNPLPMWWLGLFWLTLLGAVAYFIVFPGLGTAKGTLGWTSTGQYQAEMQRAESRYAPIFEKYRKQALTAVAADPEAQAMGQRLFLTYCAQCHGADARGSKGFPNLADADWLHGGEPQTILKTILEGRTGVMPPLGAALGGSDGAKDVAQYVRSLAGLANDSLRSARGKALFAQNCAACHGADGKGNPLLGAPNLSDKIWLYGSSEAIIVETVMKGRQNQMPAFKDIIGEDKAWVLAGYVLSLSK